jgi:hypothetical protein
MGIRGELFSSRVSTEGRTYFFNVKENRMGDVFLTIVESKPTEAENFERRSIVIFRDNVKDFLTAFQSALSFMEKPSGAENSPGRNAQGARGGSRGSTGAAVLSFDPGAQVGNERTQRAHAGFAGAGQDAAKSDKPPLKRRVVVRKKSQAGSAGIDSSAPDKN